MQLTEDQIKQITLCNGKIQQVKLLHEFTGYDLLRCKEICSIESSLEYELNLIEFISIKDSTELSNLCHKLSLTEILEWLFKSYTPKDIVTRIIKDYM